MDWVKRNGILKYNEENVGIGTTFSCFVIKFCRAFVWSHLRFPHDYVPEYIDGKSNNSSTKPQIPSAKIVLNLEWLFKHNNGQNCANKINGELRHWIILVAVI